MSTPTYPEWRERLTDSERRVVERLDKAIAKAERARSEAVSKLNPIRNRAVQRNRRALAPVTPRAPAHTQKEGQL